MTLTITHTRFDAPPMWPCVGRVDLFFSTVHAEMEQAKSLCTTCHSIERCKAAAIARAEPCGVWGGETFENGVPVRKRAPGRPRTRSAR